MENKPVISVVVRAYNQEQAIVKALSSIVSQKVDFPVQIVIGIDTSTDNTLQVVKSFCETLPAYFKADIIYHTERVKRGRNLYDALMRCEGLYIAWLDGDDYWCDSEKLMKQKQILDTQEEVGLVYTDNYLLYPDSDVLEKNYRLEPIPLLFSQLLNGNFITSGSVLFRRKLLEYVDFDFFFKRGYIADDYYMWLEFSNHTKFVHLKFFSIVYCVNRPMTKEYLLRSLQYDKQCTDMRIEYIKKYSSHTDITPTRLQDRFYEYQMKMGLNLEDKKLVTEAAKLHSTPQNFKQRCLYRMLTFPLGYEIYQLSRRIRGMKRTNRQIYHNA